MQHLIAIQFLHFLSLISFSVFLIIGCEKKKPSTGNSSVTKKIQPSPKPTDPPPPSSHIYVDTTCQPKSVMATKQVTIQSKLKSKSTNPYVKVKSSESGAPKYPPKDAAKELDKLRDEANKEGEKKDEEDFGYENCGDMTENQLQQMKAAQALKKSSNAPKTQTIKKPILSTAGKPQTTYKKQMKT